MDTINDLIENGLILKNDKSEISLHPLIADIVFEDLKPSVTSCETLINSLNFMCLTRSEIYPFYRKMLLICVNICNKIIPDKFQKYVTFLLDTFCYMEDRKDETGMEKILHKLTEIQSDLNQHDLAVYYSHQAGLEMLRNKYPRAKDLFQKSLKTCPPDYDFLMTANLYTSLGSCFRFLKNEKSAQSSYEQALQYFIRADVENELHFDKYLFMMSYALFLHEQHQHQKAISILKQALSEVVQLGTERNSLYADISYQLGLILLPYEPKTALMHFNNSFTVYNVIYADEPEYLSFLRDNVKRYTGEMLM